MTSKSTSSFLSLFESAHLSCPASNSQVMSAANNQCAMNVDSVCIKQVTPQQAMAAGPGGSCGGAPVTRLFFSASVPYSTTGQAVLPLAQARMLPGI